MNGVAIESADRCCQVVRSLPTRQARRLNRAASLDERAITPRQPGDGAQLRAAEQPPVLLWEPVDVAHHRRRHNLPQPLTSFIGRAHEIATAERLFEATRLLTLTGPGGVGKTRLGHEIAGSLLHRWDGSEIAFENGVWLVDLAALADPELVQQTVAAVLGIRQNLRQPLLTSLVDALRPRRLLLVLDNCEHLIEACATLAGALLSACPGLRVLATSRQPLGIAGETTLTVPSLSLVPSVEHRSLATVGQDDFWIIPGAQPESDRAQGVPVPEAVRLFVERAQAAMPAYLPTDDDAACILTICQRLDGIPLAIELAAARIAVLSPEQIAARLDDRFKLLTGGSRTALPRYRAMRALIDWSHDLLDQQEQVLLRRLSVFAGGWTLEAAEAVCANNDLDSAEILDLLAGLVAKSLVQVDERTSEVRYRFLETIREYAAEKLGDAGEATLLRTQHLAWLLALAERAAPALVGSQQEAWLNRLDRERENLRAARRWAVAQADAETTARLGAALWQFWWARADAADAREWVNTISPLARVAPPTRAVAAALHGAAMLAGSLADYPTCRSLFQEALTAARLVGDPHSLASVLDSLGRQLSFEGQYSEAHQHFHESLTILRQTDDRQGLARALSRFGFLQYLEGDHESARVTFAEGLLVAREAGDPAMIAEILDKQGQMFHSDGDLNGAVRSFEQAEAIWREIGQGHWLAMTLNNLGTSQTLRGELAVARTQLAEALSLSQRTGNRRRMAFALSSVATLAALEDDRERALRLDAVSAAAVAEMGIRRVPPKVPLRAQILERARQALGTAASQAVEAAEQATTLDEAVSETVAWLAEPVGSGQGASLPDGEVPATTAVEGADAVVVPTLPPASSLSPRELQVAALVARGMTNRQIAEALVITEGTAASHVKHILARLALDSRVQIATWAVARGLHQSPAT